MGLSRATHLRSLLAELGLLLGLAYVAGAGLGRVALGLVHGLLDVDANRPPAPLLVLPVAALAGVAVGGLRGDGADRAVRAAGRRPHCRGGGAPARRLTSRAADCADPPPIALCRRLRRSARG